MVFLSPRERVTVWLLRRIVSHTRQIDDSRRCKGSLSFAAYGLQLIESLPTGVLAQFGMLLGAPRSVQPFGSECSEDFCQVTAGFQEAPGHTQMVWNAFILSLITI